MFDPATMTESELIEKNIELNNKLYMSSRWGMSGDIYNELIKYINMIQNELRERNKQKIYAAYKDKLTKTIDSDEREEDKPKQKLRKLMPLL
jgi:hypothetical protein